MAWHNSGNWGSLNVADLAIIYAQLFTAINERQVLSGITQTQWYVGNGSVKTNPSSADFFAFFLGDYVSAALQDTRWKTNINNAITAIGNIVASASNPFVLGSDYTTPVDASNVLSISSSYSGSWSTHLTDSHLDVPILIKLKETLDGLSFIEYTFTDQGTEFTCTHYLSDSGTDHTSAQAAWDSALIDSPVSGGAIFWWKVSYRQDTYYYYTADIYTITNMNMDSTSLSGTAKRAFVNASAAKEDSSNLTLTMFGDSISTSTANTKTLDTTSSLSWYQSGRATNTIPFSVTDMFPATCPVSTPGPLGVGGSSNGASISINEYGIVLDVSSEFTYG